MMRPAAPLVSKLYGNTGGGKIKEAIEERQGPTVSFLFNGWPNWAMIVDMNKTKWRRLILFSGLAALPLLALAGCADSGYYTHLLSGQLDLIRQGRPIGNLVADQSVDTELRRKLGLVNQARQFARDQLHLPVGEKYADFVDLGRPHVLYNVFAAPALSLKPKTWRHPFVGALSYRGYFDKALAEEYASWLAQEGWDVHIGGVDAYSTLGWFDDPLLSSMTKRGDLALVELLFHEFAHSLLFVKSDTSFNESFATAVAEEGMRRWVASRGEKVANAMARRERRAWFVGLAKEYRHKLADLYKSDLGRDEKLKRKGAYFAEMKAAHTAKVAAWGGKNYYGRWFAGEINNAKLSTVSTYNDLAPAFLSLLQQNGGDLKRFYENCRQISKLPRKERHEKLKKLGEPETQGEINKPVPPVN